MNVAATLARPVGPLPLGGWLLAVGGGLWMLHRRGQDSGERLVTDVREVPVPVGAIASPDNAEDVILNPIIYITSPTPAAGNVTTTPAPTVTAPTPPPVPRPPVKPAVPSSVTTATRTTVLPKPAAPKPAASPGTRRYVVRSGDTLSEIGQRFGVPWRRIYTRNALVIEAAARRHGRLSSDGGHWIYPGTALVIPAP